MILPHRLVSLSLRPTRLHTSALGAALKVYACSPPLTRGCLEHGGLPTLVCCRVPVTCFNRGKDCGANRRGCVSAPFSEGEQLLPSTFPLTRKKFLHFNREENKTTKGGNELKEIKLKRRVDSGA